jgi:hypothetical protein
MYAFVMLVEVRHRILVHINEDKTHECDERALACMENSGWKL